MNVVDYWKWNQALGDAYIVRDVYNMTKNKNNIEDFSLYNYIWNKGNAK
jgi:hypothetical protein